MDHRPANSRQAQLPLHVAMERRQSPGVPTAAVIALLPLVVISLFFPRIHAQETLAPWRLFNAFFRDLPQLHPDFEAPYAADYHQTGLVATSLNAEGRPAFIMPARRNVTGLTSQWIDYNNLSRPVKTYSGNVAIANQGHFFFDEYYTDVPGVNIGYNITLNFTLDDPNLATYRWEKPFFFPLDNKGFGVREGFLVTDPDLPASFRDGIPHNFWFTTQMEMTFFYRGGEVFRFNGDDDLWVFIDGNLTSCDLGGIHASRGCEVNLDTLNLRVNSSYSMSVFHAERHTDASYFAVTTSVKPVNRAPIAANVTASVRADKSVDVTLQGFDPDNDRLSYVLTSRPTLGTITNFTSSTGTLTYRAHANATAGLDSFTFLANDGVLNSTVPGWVKINVLPLKRPPIVTNYTLNVTVGEVKWLELKADAPDFPAADLRWYLTSNPKFGRAEIVEANRTIRYEAVNNGTDERFTFQVVDPEGYVGVGVIDGIVNPLLLVIPGGLPPPVVAGIVVGSVGAAALLGTAAAYFFYNRYMAAKFSAKWQEEWMKSNINENPLFVSNFKEQVNPLYNANT